MGDAPKSLRLLPEDAEMLEALASARDFLQFFGADVSRHIETARDVVRQTLDFERNIGAVPPWTGYLAVDRSTNVVVGSCGFKGNPTPRGSVEIAYFTFSGFEGQGVATAMALALVGIAGSVREVGSVVAHTLREPNPSTFVLRKAGFRHAGNVEDPQDGPVWRWELELKRSGV